MKVEFNWKTFDSEKPQVGESLIFRVDKDLYFGCYDGFDLTNHCHVFTGGKLRLKSLSKKNTQKLCLADTNNVVWDAYSDMWI